MKNTDALYAQTLEKGLLTLEYIVESKTITLTKLSRQMGINKSTLYRYLNTLKKMGYIDQDENSAYFMTDKAGKMANGIVPQMEIRNISLCHLEGMAKATDSNSNLGFWNGKEILYLAQSRPHPVGAYVVGETIPAYCTALGRAILAYLPETLLNEYIKNTQFVAFTNKTVSTAEQLLEKLQEVRDLGYSVMDSELRGSLLGVAVPILISNEVPRYAVSLAGLVLGDTEEYIARCVPLLKASAQEIAISMARHQNMYTRDR